nr:serine-threonine kinase receptor-associated protein [Drosophila takahashii]
MSHQIGVMCLGHTDSVVELSFSKDFGSGFYLACAGLDGMVSLRHGDTGNWIANLKKHKESVWTVCFSEDARILASGGGDKKVRIWDALLGKQLSRYPHRETVSCLDLNPTASRMVSGCLGQNPCVTLFDLEKSSKKPLMEFRGHKRGVRDVIFCLEERCILTSSYDRSVKMWDCLTGAHTHSIELPHHAKSMELHYDREIVTISFSHGVFFLDPQKFEILKHRKLPYKVTAAALHPNKESYACGNSEGNVYKYDYATGNTLGVYHPDDKSPVCFLRFSPDGEICAMGLENGNITLWRQNMDKKYGLWTSISSWEDDDDDDGDVNESVS